MNDYFGFAIKYFQLKPDEFYRLTYQEFYVEMLVFLDRCEEKKKQEEERLIFHSDLKAHIANCLTTKKDGSQWTYEDFINKVQEEGKKKLTLKEARKRLGSTFNLN